MHATLSDLEARLQRLAQLPKASATVVVTGCCGRIGRAVANQLSKSGFAVRGFDRSPRPAGLLDAVAYRKGDLGEAAALASCIAGATAVVHLAACPDDADFGRVLLPTNVSAVVALLDACRAEPSVRAVVLASSGKLHAGHSGRYPITLADPTTPVCNYGATKAFAEAAAHAFALGTSTPTIALRLAWSPRTPSDVRAIQAAAGPGTGINEYLSPEDAGRCVVAALAVAREDPDALRAERRAGAAPYAVLFCQSKPPAGGVPRFDLSRTTELLSWAPRDTWDAVVVQARCASDYTDNTDVFPRSWP